MNYDATLTTAGSIIHLMIVWSKAESYKDSIVQDLQNHFEILRIFRGKWEQSKFLDNYFVFYSHSQHQKERRDYVGLLENKIKVCGDGDFWIVVFRDNNPQFETRETSSGSRIVNKRVFDKKTQYRELAGGGHRIHGSDDAWETNKDLTILFGMNTVDFCKHFDITDRQETSAHSTEEVIWNRNCVGVDGYKSIEELFYVLNNTIEYVVLRNHEVLPKEYTVEGHGDIDLLVENKNYAVYLTHAQPVFKESYRVYHILKIAGKDVPFDFRYIQDNYYSPKWEKDILATRVLKSGLFYVPSPEHQFYTLLYHAYIQKYEIKADYFPKLTNYGKAIGVTFNESIKNSLKVLDDFMLPRHYEYIRPDDKSVLYNKKNLQYSEVAYRYGECIKQLDFFEEPFGHFYSAVFENENSFVKIGTDWLLENECNVLKALDGSNYIPSIIRFEKLGDNLSLLEESRVPGIPADQFFSVQNHLTPKYVQSFVSSIIGVLKILVERQIVHRDIMAGNVLVSETKGGCSVSLIDFGWSCPISDLDKPCPVGLGGQGIAFDNKIDSYECVRLLRRLFPHSSYVMHICKAISSITKDDYMHVADVVDKLNEASRLSNNSMPTRDNAYLMYRRTRMAAAASYKDLCRIYLGVKRRLHV